jgi:hypothetical protein
MIRIPRITPALAILAGAIGALHAQPASRAPFTVDSLRSAIRYLAGDELAGRRTGTPGNLAAAHYFAAKFAEIGLAPLPGGDGYLHDFDYLAGAENGRGNALEITGPKGVKTIGVIGTDFLPMTFSGRASVAGDLLFAGYGITSSDPKYDDYAGLDPRGRIVVVMRYSPDGANPHGSFARGASVAAKVANAREHGAAGIIFINGPAEDASLPAVHFDRNFSHAEIPAVTARTGIFGTLVDPHGRTLAAVQRGIDSTRTPASFAMKGFTAKLATDVELRRSPAPNVVGLLPGSDPKLRDEFIVIGGHFDHLGWGGEGSLYGGSDSAIHHGADDNASGSAGVIALARRFADIPHRRTLVFAAFNGEEEGLLGSAALVAKSPIPLDKVAAMINMDMIGRLDSSNLIVQGTGTSPIWKELLDAQNRGRFTVKMVADGFGPSDHSSFYAAGVPVLFFFTGLHSDYHRPTDVWEKINYDGEMRVLDYVADVARAIDARDDRPTFTKTQSSERTGNGFNVYVGTIPDYAYDGKGLRLTGVADGGPAQRAGLKEGDIIVGFGGKEINNIYDYTYALGEFKPKQVVEIAYLRGGARTTTKVELGSR